MADPNYCTLLIGWPCLRAEVWAAWAQAVLSAAAIFAAVWLAGLQDRRHLARKTGALVSILDSGHQTAEKAWEVGQRSHSELKGLAVAMAYRFEQVSRTLNAAASLDLPDHRLIHSLLSGASCCEMLRGELSRIAAMTKPPEDLSYLQNVRKGLEGMTTYYNEAAEIANESVIRSPQQMLVYYFNQLTGRKPAEYC